MVQILQYFPGQLVTVILEIKNSDGYREDSTSLPLINRIILPSLTLAANYPQPMTNIDIGLYYYKFTLPTGSTAVGSYIVDISYIDPNDFSTKSLVYQIIVNAVAGNFGLSPSI